MGEGIALAHPEEGLQVKVETRRHLPKYNIGVHFLTARTFNRLPYFSAPACARIFCEELEEARRKQGFQILAFVVMPDHVHLLLWWDALQVPDLTISKVAWAVKGRSARRIVAHLRDLRENPGTSAETPPASMSSWLEPVRKPQDKPHHRNWRYQLWQQGAGCDFNIYTEHKLREKIASLHANPVRAGLAPTPEAYPWSSAASYFRVDEGMSPSTLKSSIQCTLLSTWSSCDAPPELLSPSHR